MRSGLRFKVFAAIKAMAHSHDFSFESSSLGGAYFRDSEKGVRDYIYISVVRDDEDGLRVQPSLGIAIRELNEFVCSLDPRPFKPEATPTGGIILIDDLIQEPDRMLGGWLFDSQFSLNSTTTALFQYVTQCIFKSRVFDTITSVDKFIDAIESRSIPFVAPRDYYVAALCIVGRRQSAKRFAIEERDKLVQVYAEKGLPPRDQDFKFLDSVLEYLNLSKLESKNPSSR